MGILAPNCSVQLITLGHYWRFNIVLYLSLPKGLVEPINYKSLKNRLNEQPQRLA